MGHFKNGFPLVFHAGKVLAFPTVPISEFLLKRSPDKHQRLVMISCIYDVYALCVRVVRPRSVRVESLFVYTFRSLCTGSPLI